VGGGGRISPSAINPSLFFQEARSQPDRTLVALDVDGTVSAIAPSPTEAVVDDAVRATLRRLSERYQLWFISGRDADDVRRMVGIASAGYIGAHGLEVLDEQGLRPLGSVEDVQPLLEKLVQAVTSDVPEAAPYVEYKRWSVAFHYRALPPSSQIADRLRRSVDAHLSPALRLRPGKMVLEVLPAAQHDKGRALEWLLGAIGPARVLAAGDDLTDVTMFQVVAERRARGGIDGLSVAVLHGVETPEEVVAAADTMVDGVPGLHELLLTLLDDS
jgi:trehalose-phosphatase